MRCTEVKTSKDIKDFLSLPDKLYDKRFRTQNKRVEKQILKGTHVLSSHFNVKAYIVRNNDTILARAILTTYPNDDTAYLGFFESYNNIQAVRMLILEVSKSASSLGKKKLIGPVDSSFWIRYRLKVNGFDSIYTGEPYNKPYYLKLWEAMGFAVSEEYYSNQLRIPTELDVNPKYKSRLNMVINKGYEIRTTSKNQFTSDFKDVYRLLSRLYSKFPIYKHINEEEFIKIFGFLRYVLDYKWVNLAYIDDRLAGFMVCIPNYSKGSILENLRHKHREYIMMYLGVDKQDPGLGGAFSEICRDKLSKSGCSCIAALIHKGNTSGTFYKELTTDTYNYVLMQRDIY